MDTACLCVCVCARACVQHDPDILISQHYLYGCTLLKDQWLQSPWRLLMKRDKGDTISLRLFLRLTISIYSSLRLYRDMSGSPPSIPPQRPTRSPLFPDSGYYRLNRHILLAWDSQLAGCVWEYIVSKQHLTTQTGLEILIFQCYT